MTRGDFFHVAGHKSWFVLSNRTPVEMRLDQYRCEMCIMDVFPPAWKQFFPVKFLRDTRATESLRNISRKMILINALANRI